MENSLKNLPANQIDAYNEVLTRIKATGSFTSDTSNQFLTWIFHAKRPLQMDELLEALYVKEWQADIDRDRKFDAVDIVRMCQSLVVHEKSSGVVRFIHPTVQEFLKSLKLPVIGLAKTGFNLSWGQCL
jgi:GPI inositol-deacylase, winged helix domain